MHNPDPLCVAIYYSIFLQPTNTTLNKDRVMINASVNGVCNEGKPSKVAIQDIMHSTITERNVTMIKRVHHGQRAACLF